MANLIDTIKKDQVQVNNILNVIGNTSKSQPGTRQDRFKRLVHIVDAHTGAVDELLREAAPGNPPRGDQSPASYDSEKQEIRRMISEINDLPPDSAEWLVRLTSLKDMLEQFMELEQGVVASCLGDEQVRDESVVERFRAQKGRLLKAVEDEAA